MVNFSFKLFFFLGRRKGILLTKRRPFRPQTPTIPTARSRCAIALMRHTFFKFAMKLNSARDLKLNLIKSDRKI